MSLYAIEDTLVALDAERRQAIEDGDAEYEKAIDAEIAAYLTKEADKAASFAALIMARKDLIENAKRAVERDKAILRAAEEDVERLQAIALAVMQRFDVKEIKDSRTGHGLKRVGNGGKEPLEISAWPRDAGGGFKALALSEALRLMGTGFPVVNYCKPDTEAIREALKHGESVNGAKLLDRGEHVRVI